MEREIKFRAWDKEKKQWVDVGKVFSNWNDTEYVGVAAAIFKEGTSPTFRLNSKGRIQWVRHTGLKDKNDVEIYEGDIIQWKHPSSGKIYADLVIFEDGCFCIDDPDGNLLFYPLEHGGKVIGNKFQNPELLEEEENNEK